MQSSRYYIVNDDIENLIDVSEKIEYYEIIGWKMTSYFFLSKSFVLCYYALYKKIDDSYRWNEIHHIFFWYTITEKNIDKIISIEIDMLTFVECMTFNLRTSRWSIFE